MFNFFKPKSKYDLHGAYHYNSYEVDENYKAHVDFVVEFFKGKNGTLLDVGCGDGFISQKLDNIGFLVTGVDLNQKAIDLAIEKNPSLIFYCRDLNTCKEFDFVLCSEVIEHVENDLEFLQELDKHFKKELFLSTPERGKMPFDKFHVREYSVKEFADLLSKVFENFKVVQKNNKLYAFITKRK